MIEEREIRTTMLKLFPRMNQQYLTDWNWKWRRARN